eukprot:410239-Ditylum_brightwellii.AAC.1
MAPEGQTVDVTMEEENKRKEKDVIKETVTNKMKKSGEKAINKGVAKISMLWQEFNISKGITKFNARTKLLGVVYCMALVDQNLYVKLREADEIW